MITPMPVAASGVRSLRDETGAAPRWSRRLHALAATDPDTLWTAVTTRPH